MSAETMQCRQARFEIGADPYAVPDALAAHLQGCEACRSFRDETRELDARLREALAVPLSEFRQRKPRVRQLAMAASVVLALIVAGGFWMLRPGSALATDVLEHVALEPGSWDSRDVQPASAVAEIFRAAGVQFDSALPVVYAVTCSFRGRNVPHLVVQTVAGPLTVMVLAHEEVTERREFSEHGYHGVMVPSGTGSIAIVARAGEVPDALAAEVVSDVQWRQ